MATKKLSEIASGGAIAGATDKSVVVRSGTTDLLVTPVALDIAQTFTATQTLNPGSGIAGYMQAGAFEEAVFSNGNSGTSKALNLDNGNLQSLTITGAVAITLTAPTHPGKFTVVITQDGSGHVYSIAGLKYPGGSAPTYSTAAGKIDVFSIVYDGANFYGMGGIAFS